MKPAVSAMNDWLKTIIVHKSFQYMHIFKTDAHYAVIELAHAQQYDNVSNHYETTNIASIHLEVHEIKGQLTNVVKFFMTMPTGFVDARAGDQIKCETYTNITLKNLIDFVEFFRDKYRICDRESLSCLYNIPNHNNMGFVYDYKPFKALLNSISKTIKKNIINF